MLSLINEKIIENKVWVFIAISVFVAFGISSLSKISIDAVPDITNVQVLINSKTGGLDPEQVEKTVTYNIETEMAGLPQVKDVRSLSKFGLSQVVVIFNDGTDIYWARQLVSEKLQAAARELPAGIVPELGPISTGLGEVLMYVLLPRSGSELSKKSEKDQLLYLRTYHDFVVRPYLKSNIDGVADVDATGGYKKEIHIDFHPSKMEKYGVSIGDILEKVENIGESSGGGYIERNNKQIIVRAKGETTIQTIQNMPVKLNIFGSAIRLKDIAEVRADHVQRVGAATYQGKQTVLGTVLMLMGGNSRLVALQGEKALNEIDLPADIEIKIVYTRSYLVNQTIKTVAVNLAEGAVLVVTILFLIMGNFRAALLVALAIPLSMLGAVIGMNQFGISANLMSLGAIDFGILVDGSVVMIENLVQKLEQKPIEKHTKKEKIGMIIESFNEIIRPVVLGLIIIMLVYIPILTLEGVEGKMFHPMAVTVLMAIAMSLVVAIFIMPLLSYVFIMKRPLKQKHKEPILFQWMLKIYSPILYFTMENNIRRRLAIPGIAGILFVISILLFMKSGSDFMPPLNEGDMVINFTHPADISLSSALESQVKAEKEIKKFKEVRHVFSRIGTPESATDPMGVNLTDTFLILNDTESWPEVKNGYRRTKDELYKDLEKSVAPFVGDAEISENQPIAMRFNEILEGSRADVSLRIYGKDLKTLIQMQNRAVEILEGIEGIEEAELDALTALKISPILELKLNYDNINKYNVDISEVNDDFVTAMAGREVGSFYEYDWRFPVIVKMAEEYRDRITEISRIPVDLPEPGTIPLGKLAVLQQTEDVVAIARANGNRYAGVAVTLGDRDTLSFVEEAKKKIQTGLDFKEGYRTEWGGQYKNLERARDRLLYVIPFVFVFIFILLFQSFKSIKQTLFILLSIPFAATGGIFLLFLRDINFSVSSSVGFITLSGIAILNGMVLITFINQLRERGVPLREAVITGAFTRLRPVIMTALVASLGFLPMALNTGLGAEVQRPLATVVIGGLVSSTLLTLLILPMLYYWAESRKI